MPNRLERKYLLHDVEANLRIDVEINLQSAEAEMSSKNWSFIIKMYHSYRFIFFLFKKCHLTFVIILQLIFINDIFRKYIFLFYILHCL